MKEEKEHSKKILTHYINDVYTREEALEVLELAKDRKNQLLFEEMAENVWEESECEIIQTRLEHEKLLEEGASLLKTLNKPDRKNLFTTYWRVAASVIILIMSGVAGNSLFSYWQNQHIAFVEVTTGIGERKVLELPDGTMVDINTCSTLRYPKTFVGEKREIELTGEAYFQVKRDPEKRFIVKTAHFDVKVLGTKFDVKAYPTDELLSVSVENGKVQVEMPEAMMRLKGNDQLLINRKLQEFNKRRSEVQVNGWKYGELSFYATPIRDVAKELERIYGCKIIFQKDVEFDNLITGVHDNQSLEAVLTSLEYVCGIKYRKEKECILLYK